MKQYMIQYRLKPISKLVLIIYWVEKAGLLDGTGKTVVNHSQISRSLQYSKWEPDMNIES